MRLIELIRSLKRLASGKLKDLVFLSAGSLMRLKSPRTIHGPVIDCAMEANSARKAGLSSCKVGAYTLVKVRNVEYSLLVVMSELSTVRCDRVLGLWLQAHGRRVSTVSCCGRR